TVRITQPDDVQKARTAIEGVGTTVAGNVFSAVPERDIAVSVNGQNITVVLTEPAIVARTQSAVQQSIEIVRRRIDELGTTEPVIQQQGASRILVQVPGLDDPQRLKELL